MDVFKDLFFILALEIKQTWDGLAGMHLSDRGMKKHPPKEGADVCNGGEHHFLKALPLLDNRQLVDVCQLIGTEENLIQPFAYVVDDVLVAVTLQAVLLVQDATISLGARSGQRVAERNQDMRKRPFDVDLATRALLIFLHMPQEPGVQIGAKVGFIVN
ncbi:hypothetical protein D3C77_361140 [compost metagenome]